MSQKPSPLRRKYIVDPKLQWKIVGSLGGVAVIMAVLICLIAYTWLMRIEVLFHRGDIAPNLLPAAFDRMANLLMIRLGLIVSLMVAVFTGLGVILTHRIAGPIFHLQNHLKKYFKEKSAGSLKFRKNDEFQDLPDLINKLLNTDGQ